MYSDINIIIRIVYVILIPYNLIALLLLSGILMLFVCLVFYHFARYKELNYVIRNTEKKLRLNVLFVKSWLFSFLFNIMNLILTFFICITFSAFMSRSGLVSFATQYIITDCVLVVFGTAINLFFYYLIVFEKNISDSKKRLLFTCCITIVSVIAMSFVTNILAPWIADRI